MAGADDPIRRTPSEAHARCGAAGAGVLAGHRRPLPAPPQLDATRDQGRLRLRARDRRRPLPLAYVELHDDEKAATVTDFVERALAHFAEHGILAKRLMTDNGFSYVKEPLSATATRPPRNPTPDHRAVSPADERQSGALPPDHGPGVGLRARLPLTSTTKPGAATLARPLQPDTTTQLTRRPTPDQPRSQRPWVGHLRTAWREEDCPWVHA